MLSLGFSVKRRCSFMSIKSKDEIGQRLSQAQQILINGDSLGYRRCCSCGIKPGVAGRGESVDS